MIHNPVLGESQFSAEWIETPSTDITDIRAVGDGRLLVVGKSGLIWVMGADGEFQPEPFLDIADRVYDGTYEAGLFSVALHPDFDTNRLFFVNYVRVDDSGEGFELVIQRFGAKEDALIADMDTGEEILLIAKDNPTHNGGMLAFGPHDGMLYISVGDDNDDGQAQNRSNLLGKVLRIDVDGGRGYAIPLDNPFVNSFFSRGEIWSYGLRNPWKMGFDEEGNMFIGDVGHLGWEEINFGQAGVGGRNYGWPCFEGNWELNASLCELTRPRVSMPVYTYAHEHGRCSVTGGVAHEGGYLFSDYCSAEIQSLYQTDDGQWLIEHFGTITANGRNVFVTTFGKADDGEIYVGLLTDRIIRLDGLKR